MPKPGGRVNGLEINGLGASQWRVLEVEEIEERSETVTLTSPLVALWFASLRCEPSAAWPAKWRAVIRKDTRIQESPSWRLRVFIYWKALIHSGAFLLWVGADSHDSIFIGPCYGLNICVPSPNSCVEIPVPKVTVLEVGTFRRWLDRSAAFKHLVPRMASLVIVQLFFIHNLLNCWDLSFQSEACRTFLFVFRILKLHLI